MIREAQGRNLSGPTPSCYTTSVTPGVAERQPWANGENGDTLFERAVRRLAAFLITFPIATKLPRKIFPS